LSLQPLPGSDFIFFKNNKRYIKLFLLIFVPSVVVCAIAVWAVAFSLSASANRVGAEGGVIQTPRPPISTAQPTATEDGGAQASPLPTEDDGETLLKPPARTNFMLVALDKEAFLTDVIIVGCFYRDTGEVRMMFVPRDTYTQLPQERLDAMRAEGRRPPTEMKINALRSYGGQTNGVQYLMDQVGEMLGVHFKYYAEIDIPQFKKIVDILGPVTIEVPAALNYDDPEQNLHIHIEAGIQQVDGETAEGLVRFRGYPQGDIARNDVQAEFLKQLLRQALKRETIMRDPVAIAQVILNDIRHNLDMVEMLKYIPYIGSISGEKITTYKMPGNGTTGSPSYYLADVEKLPEVVREVFYAETEPLPETTGQPASTEAPPAAKPSHGLSIQILNGSRVAGLASSKADTLANDGYTVNNVDVYKGTKVNTTRILTRNENTGEDLIPYFVNAAVTQDDSIASEYDIVIVLGQGER
jgi:LCP family protein required for cell wall assembly